MAFNAVPNLEPVTASPGPRQEFVLTVLDDLMIQAACNGPGLSPLTATAWQAWQAHEVVGLPIHPTVGFWFG